MTKAPCSALVSIIIPVYRAEKYLARCVESVGKQTYENLQIILVDDGSPDGCPALCDDLAGKDSRIQVIHKANGGASSARNAGLEAAKGAYICFVDSDDAVPEDSIAQLVKALREGDGQYAAGICAIEGSSRVKWEIPAFAVIDAQTQPMALLKYLCSPGSYSPYAKIFCADRIRSRGLRFREDHECSEDSLFIREYMAGCDRICLAPHVVYCYNTGNDNSLSKKSHRDYCLYFRDKLQALQALAENLPLEAAQREDFLSQRAIHGIRVSLNHYFRHWGDRESRLRFTKLTLDTLTPWIKTPSPEIWDAGLQGWWKGNKKDVLAGKPASVARRHAAWEALRRGKAWAAGLRAGKQTDGG